MPHFQFTYLNDDDHRVEIVHFLFFESLESPEPLIRVAEIRNSGPRAELNISTTSRISMEGIPKYSGTGGGLS